MGDQAATPQQGTVLVAGGAGYIGSHIVRALHQLGRPVVVLDDLSSGHRWAVPAAVPLVVADVGDEAVVRETVVKYAVASVVHCAALIQVGESMRQPGRYWQANVAKTIALVRTLAAAGCRTLVFSSTAAVYGEPLQTPIDESHPLQPNNVYGHTKFAVEQFLANCSAAGELRYASLRYFNAAGADESAEIGEAHGDESHLIPLVLRAAAAGNAPILVFGDDWPTADGTCVRDYVHATDLALAHVAALARLAEVPSVVCNLGSGRGYSVREVIDQVQRTTGLTVPVQIAPRRSGDAAVLVASNERARLELQWVPRHSALDEIVGSAWRWEQRKRT